MNPQLQPLIAYIDAHRKLGTPDEKIRSDLQSAGWAPQYIDEAYGSLIPVPFLAPVSEPEPTQVYSPTIGQPQVQTYNPADPLKHPAASETELQPQKYTLRASVKDLFRAIKHNPKTFFGVLGLSIVIFFSISTVISFIVAGLISFREGSAPTFLSLPLLIIVGILCFGMIGLSTAAVMSGVVTALKDSIEGRTVSLAETAKQITKNIVRVWLSVLLLLVVIVGPLALAVFIMFGVIIMSFNTHATPSILILAVIFYLAASIWILIGSLRYALAPYIAMLEPEVPIKQTLSRSYHLLKKGGQWFLFKTLAVLIILVLIISAMAGLKPQQIDSSQNPLVSAIDIILTLTVYGILYMLYRNRRAVKG